MTIKKNCAVTLEFELHIDDAKGMLVEKVDPKHPFSFIFGSGHLLEAFEHNIYGLEADTAFEFSLKHDESYGPVNKDAIIELPRDVFTEDGKETPDLKQGNVIHMEDKEGDPMEGKVLKISGDKVKMDFNHPLAGKNLYFKGKVTAVRKATQKEIDHGHTHGPGGHHH